MIRTTAQCPFSWLSTWTNVPNGSVRLGGRKIFGLSVLSTRRLFGHSCIN